MLGLAVGHAFDRGLVATLKFGSPENIQRIKASFFETTFLLSGYVAKSDGRVSEEEVQHTELVFDQMKLDGEQRKRRSSCSARGRRPISRLSRFYRLFCRSAEASGNCSRPC